MDANKEIRDVGSFTGVLDATRIVDRLINAYRGNYVDVACKQAGISKSTYCMWRRLANDPNADEAYRRLIDRIDEAEANAETRCVDILSGCDDPKIVLEFMARVGRPLGPNASPYSRASNPGVCDLGRNDGR